MKKIFSYRYLILTAIVFITSCHKFYSQTAAEIELPVFNIFNNSKYTIQAYQFTPQFKFKYAFYKDGEKLQEFTLELNTLEMFKEEFERAANQMFTPAPNKTTIEEEAKRIYYMYISASKLADDLNIGPVAGNLYLRKEVIAQRVLEPSVMKEQISKARKMLKNPHMVDKKRGFLFFRKPYYKQKDVAVGQNSNESIKIWRGYISRRQAIVHYIKHYEDSLKRDLLREYEMGKNRLCTTIDAIKALESKRGFRVLNKKYSDSLIMETNDTILILNNNITLLTKELDQQYSLIKNFNYFDSLKSIKINDSLISEFNYYSEQIDSALQKNDWLKDSLRDPKQIVLKESMLNMFRKRISILNQKDLMRGDLIISKNITPIDNELQNDTLTQGDKELIIDKYVTPIQTLYERECIKIGKLMGEINTYNKLSHEIEMMKNLKENKEHGNERNAEESKLYQSKIDSLSSKIDSLKLLLDVKIDSLDAIVKDFPNVNLEVENVQFEFKDGFIENLKVVGNIEYKKIGCPSELTSNNKNKDLKEKITLKFDNYYPLGFSREKDFQNLNSGDTPRLISTYRNNNKIKGDMYYFSTGELIENYIQEHKLGRRDFSPKNGEVAVDFGSLNSEKNDTENILMENNLNTQGSIKVKLSKLERSKLFEAYVYSDFLGINSDNANGLIQTDILKRINLNTKRYIMNRFRFKYFLNIGYLTYIEPILTISKIENNNKYLSIQYKDNFVNGEYQPLKYATTTDIRKYENFSTGFDLNYFLIDVPNIKSTFYIDGGFRFGLTAFVDSLRKFENNKISIFEAKTFNSNSLDLIPASAIWKFQTDERYEFDINFTWNVFFLRNDDILQVSNSDSYLQDVNKRSDTFSSRNFFRVELNAQYNNNNQGKLFFRYRYFWQFGFMNTGFSQIQLGYSFYINAALTSSRSN